MVLLLSTRKVICSRDVTYRSDSFTFMRALELGDSNVRDALRLHDAEPDEEADQLPTEPAAGGQSRRQPACSSGTELGGQRTVGRSC